MISAKPQKDSADHYFNHNIFKEVTYMFDKFGEMTHEGINTLAANLKAEGDTDSLKELAKENGLDEEVVDMFTKGEIPELTDAMSAAIGKIDIEAAELKPKEIVCDWIEYVKARCFEDEAMAIAVRRTNKTLKGAIAALLKWSFTNAYAVDKEIVKEAKISSATVKMGIPGMGTAKRLINEYYLRGKA